MKKRILIAGLFLGLCGALIAQISNVTVRVNDEQDKVTITYNLSPAPGVNAYDIKVRITMAGEVLEPRGLSGDLGQQVRPGLGKKITWDVHQDVTELAGGELKVEVMTDTKINTSNVAAGPCPVKMLPHYAGLGGVVLTGAGLVLLGSTNESDAKEQYDIYKNNLNENAAVYNDKSREDVYTEANSKHKKGTAMMVAGGVVLLGGGLLYISRIIKIKKYNKRCAGEMGAAPDWELKPSLSYTAGGPGLGLSFSYHF